MTRKLNDGQRPPPKDLACFDDNAAIIDAADRLRTWLLDEAVAAPSHSVSKATEDFQATHPEDAATQKATKRSSCSEPDNARESPRSPAKPGSNTRKDAPLVESILPLSILQQAVRLGPSLLTAAKTLSMILVIIILALLISILRDAKDQGFKIEIVKSRSPSPYSTTQYPVTQLPPPNSKDSSSSGLEQLTTSQLPPPSSTSATPSSSQRRRVAPATRHEPIVYWTPAPQEDLKRRERLPWRW